LSEEEKFDDFIQDLVDHNEKQYGNEMRSKYGDDAIDSSNAKLMNITEEQYALSEELAADVNEALKLAFEQGDPSSELAQKACELHKKWLCCFWTNYTKEAHIGVTQMYTTDVRFRAYYDSIAKGCAEFLRDAVAIYCK